MSGSSTHCGVGRTIACPIFIHFRAVSHTVRPSHAKMFNVKFRAFRLLGNADTHISAYVREGAAPLVAGDINPSIGRAPPHDEIEFLGFCGCDDGMKRGWSLVDWALATDQQSKTEWTRLGTTIRAVPSFCFFCVFFPSAPF